VRIAYAVDNVSVGGNYYFHDRKRRREFIVSLVNFGSPAIQLRFDKISRGVYNTRRFVGASHPNTEKEASR